MLVEYIQRSKWIIAYSNCSHIIFTDVGRLCRRPIRLNAYHSPLLRNREAMSCEIFKEHLLFLLLVGSGVRAVRPTSHSFIFYSYRIRTARSSYGASFTLHKALHGCATSLPLLHTSFSRSKITTGSKIFTAASTRVFSRAHFAFTHFRTFDVHRLSASVHFCENWRPIQCAVCSRKYVCVSISISYNLRNLPLSLSLFLSVIALWMPSFGF